MKGAVHLSFPDIGVGSLASTLPDKDARILIYCNDNFFNDESAFASKIATESLNLSTYITLYDYGYRNVWELGSEARRARDEDSAGALAALRILALLCSMNAAPNARSASS